MRIVGTFMIAVLLLATAARAVQPDMARALCSGTLVAADVCQLPALPAKTTSASTKSCCLGLPEFGAPWPGIHRMLVRGAPMLARTAMLPHRAARAGPWRPPRG